MRLADRELDRVGRRRDHGADRCIEIFYPAQKIAFIKKTMVDGHVEAAMRAGIEQTIQAIEFHRQPLVIPKKNGAVVKSGPRLESGVGTAFLSCSLHRPHSKIAACFRTLLFFGCIRTSRTPRTICWPAQKNI